MADLDAATTAAESAIDGELPAIDGLTADMRHSLVEILADAAMAATRPLIEAEAAARERQRIRDGSDHWPGGVAGPAWYKLPADLLDGDDDGR